MRHEQRRQAERAGVAEDKFADLLAQGPVQLAERLVEQQARAAMPAGCASAPRGRAARPKESLDRARRSPPSPACASASSTRSRRARLPLTPESSPKSEIGADAQMREEQVILKQDSQLPLPAPAAW